MLGIYNRIDKVTIKDKGERWDGFGCYLLTGDKVNDAPGGVGVDLTGDCDFNEFEFYTREKVADVSSVEDIIKFAKDHNDDTDPIIKLYTDKNHPENLIVGAEKDMVILPDLQFAWAEDLNLDIDLKEMFYDETPFDEERFTVMCFNMTVSKEDFMECVLSDKAFDIGNYIAEHKKEDFINQLLKEEQGKKAPQYKYNSFIEDMCYMYGYSEESLKNSLMNMRWDIKDKNGNNQIIDTFYEADPKDRRGYYKDIYSLNVNEAGDFELNVNLYINLNIIERELHNYKDEIAYSTSLEEENEDEEDKEL